MLVLFDVLSHLSDEHPIRAKRFERIGLWFFGIAVLAEILAYPYSQRNDTLSSQQGAEQQAKIAELDNSTQGLRTDAENARAQAALAKEKSDEASAKAESFRLEIAALEVSAADAKAAQQEVETKLALQQERAATAEKSLIELQEKVKGRSVSNLQKLRFNELTVNKHKGRVRIVALPDPEAIAFGNDLRDLLLGAGWTVPPLETTEIITPGGVIGLELTVTSIKPFAVPDSKEPNTVLIESISPVFHGVILRNSLEAVGIPISRVFPHSGPSVHVDEVVLTVGHKPIT
jgi:hypothetical protein